MPRFSVEIWHWRIMNGIRRIVSLKKRSILIQNVPRLILAKCSLKKEKLDLIHGYLHRKKNIVISKPQEYKHLKRIMLI